MFNIVQGVAVESLDLLYKMSPYLLFGFLIAGVLHIFFSLDTIARHLGKSNVGSVTKAVILGIPLPICSCGVIPAAIALRKKGASRGAVVSFLIATPINGVDSILATYSLMGLFFTIFRLVTSALTAFVAGILTNIFIPTKCEHGICEEEYCASCHEHEGHEYHGGSKIAEMFRYAFIELLGDIWKWLIVGILIGGIISYLIPDTFIQRYLGSTWVSMFVMLAVGIPMYVCSTGSIPIATALMLKGMSPGAALVFLLAGPATNAVTITVIGREMGRPTTVLYVGTIAAMSILSGSVLNLMWPYLNVAIPSMLHPISMLPLWFEKLCAAVLSVLILMNMVRAVRKK